MSNTEKSKSIPFTTPRFKALWAHLDEPDTKFNPDGVYSTRAVIDPSEPEAPPSLNFWTGPENWRWNRRGRKFRAASFLRRKRNRRWNRWF